MKKLVKGLMVLSIGVLIGGCSCSKEKQPEVITNNEGQNTIYEDVSNNFSELYQQAVKSTVRVIAKTQLGSGVVYKEEGNLAYILTNAHVLTDINGNDYYSDIEIVFSNYVRVKGTFVALDKNEDVAVISIPKSDNYITIYTENDKDNDRTINDDNIPQVGEAVFSIGNPNGNYFSVTTGVISATKIKTTTDYISGSSDKKTYVYNSTATINPGNSGGPMFNSKGEVIAINTMQPGDTSTYRNYNYSIPINYFIKVADYLVAHIGGTPYKRAYLNITGRSICDYSTSDISSLGITVKSGVYVTDSGETEVSTGRIITQVGDVVINTLADYEYALLSYSTGEQVRLTTVSPTGLNTKPVTITMR